MRALKWYLSRLTRWNIPHLR